MSNAAAVLRERQAADAARLLRKQVDVESSAEFPPSNQSIKGEVRHGSFSEEAELELRYERKIRYLLTLEQQRKHALKEAQQRLRDSADALKLKAELQNEIDELQQKLQPLRDAKAECEELNIRDQSLQSLYQTLTQRQFQLDKQESDLTRRGRDIERRERLLQDQNGLFTKDLERSRSFYQTIDKMEQVLRVLAKSRWFREFFDSDGGSRPTFENIDPDQIASLISKLTDVLSNQSQHFMTQSLEYQARECQLNERQKELDEQQHAMDSQLNQSRTFKSSLIEREANLKQLSISLDSYQEALRDRASQISKSDAALKDKERQLSLFEDDLKERERLAQAIMEQNDSKQAYYRNIDQQVRQQQMEQLKRSSALDSLELELARSKRSLEERLAQIDSLKQQWNEKKSLIEQRDASLRARERELLLLEQALAMEREEVRSQLARMRVQQETVQGQQESMLSIGGSEGSARSNIAPSQSANNSLNNRDAQGGSSSALTGNIGNVQPSDASRLQTLSEQPRPERNVTVESSYIPAPTSPDQSERTPTRSVSHVPLNEFESLQSSGLENSAGTSSDVRTHELSHSAIQPASNADTSAIRDSALKSSSGMPVSMNSQNMSPGAQSESSSWWSETVVFESDDDMTAEDKMNMRSALQVQVQDYSIQLALASAIAESTNQSPSAQRIETLRKQLDLARLELRSLLNEGKQRRGSAVRR